VADLFSWKQRRGLSAAILILEEAIACFKWPELAWGLDSFRSDKIDLLELGCGLQRSFKDEDDLVSSTLQK
jgi:hypothetical protein